MKALFIIIVSVMAITGCNNGRYEVAKSHVTGEDCYVLDWKDGTRLPATSANIELADGYFWADPEQCHP